MDQMPLFRPRLLIVEDEAIVAMEIQDRIEDLGWEAAATAATGPDAVRLARRERPDAILMDITLRGGMSGLEAAEAIRAERPVPILFLTATVDERILARIRALDPEADVLSKPFEAHELRREIERMLGRAGR
jgi:CheY-like chemotaxis protein